ncbi:hypothetical protein GCM10010390_30760 [Streptomyces mordarskii]|uniref:Uncharacterized protein n=1 Tax=Streptomyces mordarskii TaxID=1226758 RepID=A0ABP3MUE7_9ACTN
MYSLLMTARWEGVSAPCEEAARIRRISWLTTAARSTAMRSSARGPGSGRCPDSGGGPDSGREAGSDRGPDSGRKAGSVGG